ncbi:LysR family transcriptional regulator [Roseobacter weihaiensis]|uniref:LysR family transcriptional regulator n=1 Tax=Roseobacter weihaiensis TaxID=2763262 RepID=UPI001D09A407|nr:LysR family transcriptional regulator [Roseobacter sp. H9]
MKTDLRRLRYFLKLYEMRNYRAAADQLGITQPALSRSISQLEHDLGFPLFERDTRNVGPTPAGTAFQNTCRDAVDLLEGGLLRARKIASGQIGNVVIGYTEIAIAGILTSIVEAFRAANPDIRVDLRAAWTDAQYDLLRNNNIDVGFMTGPMEDDSFHSIPVQSDPLVVLLPRAHPLAELESIPVSALRRAPFVTGNTDRWAVFHRHLYGLCSKAGFEPDVVQTGPDTLSIIGLVACGMGVTIQADNAQVRADPRIITRPVKDLHAPVMTYAVWRKNMQDKAGQLMSEYLRAAFDPTEAGRAILPEKP